MKIKLIVLYLLFLICVNAFDVRFDSKHLKKTDSDIRFDVEAEDTYTEQYIFSYIHNQRYSWQVSYVNFGKELYMQEESREKRSAKTYSLGLEVPLANIYSVSTNVKVGVHSWQYKDQGNERYGQDLYYGLKWNMPFTQTLSAISSYERYRIEEEELNKLFLGVEYKF